MKNVASRLMLRIGAALAVGGLAAGGGVARAQAVYDAQVPFSDAGLSPALSGPEGVAMEPDGTIFVADTGNKRIVKIVSAGGVGGAAGSAAYLNATAAALTVSGATFKGPSALAVNSATGALYVADYAGGAVYSVVNPETHPTATAIAYLAGAEHPTALAVDSANNLYIADATQEAIYKLANGTTPAVKLATPAGVKPVGLTTDAKNNVYFADATGDEIYVYDAATASASVYVANGAAGSITDFKFSSAAAGLPIGMGFDPAGNLFVLDSAALNLVEATSKTDLLAPFSGSTAVGSMAVGPSGDLYYADQANAQTVELFYENNPLNFGNLTAGTASANVTENFYFTSGDRGLAFYETMQGDQTGELAAVGHLVCGTNTDTTSVSAGTACTQLFYAKYISAGVNGQTPTPGLRSGVAGLKDYRNEILAVPAVGVNQAGSMALYPGTQTILSQTGAPLYEPQGLAVSGDGVNMFLADEGGTLTTSPPTYANGAVWMYPSSGGSRSQITGSFTTPTALALDPAGNLYVADYNGFVTVVSALGGNGLPYSGAGVTLNLAGVTLNHPMALAFDPQGNLYIGDMGPEGVMATASSPGFIVKVPVGPLSCTAASCTILGGPPVELSYKVGGIPVVFPQSLTTDATGNLYIADGGDGSTDMGGVDAVPASTGAAAALNIGYSLNQPTGLGLDAANDLYILDGYNGRILVAPLTFAGGAPAVETDGNGNPLTSLLGQGDSGLTQTLVTPSNLAVWPGGSKITVTDIGFQQQGSSQTQPTQVITLNAFNTTIALSNDTGSAYGVDVGNQIVDFNTASTDTVHGCGFSGFGRCGEFTLSSCANFGSTLDPGVAQTCAPTVTYSGSLASSRTGTFTLKGSAFQLGNQINATAYPSTPIGDITGTQFTLVDTATITITNSGSGYLDITNIQVTGVAVDGGGTCAAGTALAPNASCTVIENGTGGFGNATVAFTDNTGGVAGTVQTYSTFFFPVFAGVATPRVVGAAQPAQGRSQGATQVQTIDNHPLQQ